MDNLKRKWLILSVSGLSLIGLGVSIIGEATIRKANGELWVGCGTVGLVILNSGVAIFGEAVKTSVLRALNTGENELTE